MVFCGHDSHAARAPYFLEPHAPFPSDFHRVCGFLDDAGCVVRTGAAGLLELQGPPGAVLAGGAARGCLALLRLRRGRGAHRLRRAAVLRRLHRGLQEEGLHQRQGTRRLRLGGNADRSRPRRVQHQDENRDVLQRGGHDESRRSRRSEHVRDAGARRLFPRRRIAEGRTQEIPHHQRRLQHVRAADAAVGDLVRLVHGQPGRLCPPEERRLPRQRRAADVPAGLLLPDPGGRSGHRAS